MINRIKRFKQFIKEQQILIEDRIEFIKNQFKDKINTSHDENAQYKNSDDIVDHFSKNADPTTKKTHTSWIVNRYNKGDFKQEDHPRIKSALTEFEKHKSKLEKKDLNQYKSLSDVESAVEPHTGKAASKKEEKKQAKIEGADLIHDNNGVTIHHIKTEKAACLYGSGTKWCTAGREDNLFNKYNKEGPLYVIQHGGRKYQLHNASKQLMDENDKPEVLAAVHPDIQKEMAKSTHPEIQKANIIHHNPQTKSEEVVKALNDPSLKFHALSHPNLPKEHIDKALDDKDEYVRKVAAGNISATKEHIDKALNDKDIFVRSAAAGNISATKENIDKALDDKDQDVRSAAARNISATKEHIDKALDDKDVYVRLTALKHPKVTAEHITKALDDKDKDVRLTALEHPKVTAEHISKALKDKDSGVRAIAVNHQNATAEHINKALNDPDEYVRNEARKAKERLTRNNHENI